MRFLHAADIHLDSPLMGLRRRAGARGDELADATRRAFSNLVQFALDQKIDLLLIAGDNYDGKHRDYGSLQFFAREMDRLHRAGTRVVMIRGNHDAENQMQLRMPDGVHLLSVERPESIPFPDLGVIVHGQSYPRRDVKQNLAAVYPDAVSGLLNIGLLHTAVDGFGGTHVAYAPCTVRDLKAKNYDYWALGHVHERTEIATDPWIVYPGNLQARHINEGGVKGATLVTVTGGRIAEVVGVPLDVVRWANLSVDISACSSIDDVSSAIETALLSAVDEADGRTVVARISVSGRTKLHRLLKLDAARLDAEAARAAESAGDVWIERVELKTQDADATSESASDALSVLIGEVEALKGSPDAREKVRDQVGALPKKFSAALRKEAGLDNVDDQMLDEIINDARDILLAKLAG